MSLVVTSPPVVTTARDLGTNERTNGTMTGIDIDTETDDTDDTGTDVEKPGDTATAKFPSIHD